MIVYVLVDKRNGGDEYIGVYGTKERANEILNNFRIIWTQYETRMYHDVVIPEDVLKAKVDFDVSFYEIIEDELDGS